MSSTRRRVLAGVAALVILAVAAVAALLLVADDDEDAETASEETVLPLLGTEGRVPQRAALAVKVGNTEEGRPPTALTQADVVFEEMVEGGLTRLLAVYHSQDPDAVGPVRSARSTDLFILTELGRPLFAWSGANPTFAAAVTAADLIDVGVTAVPDAYQRDPNRAAPHNLYTDPASLREAASDDEAASMPPPALFSYRAADAPLSGPGVEPAAAFHAGGVGDLTTQIDWEWDAASASWLRSQDGTPHVDSDGERVAVANVVVRVTPYGDSGVRDAAGAIVPEAQAVGEGDVWLLSAGQAQPGRWRKPSPEAPTTYTDADGAPLLLAPGQTWVEVLPPGTGEIRR